MPDTMVYKWRNGASAGGLPAQVVGEQLESIRQSHNGRMTPANVVEAARPETAPLHPAFEWDDAAAAESWRQEQARFIIRHVAVEVKKDEASEPKTIRAFVSLSEDKAQHYTSTVAAMSDPALRQQVLGRAWGELQAWRARYNELKEFAGLFSLMDEVGEKIAS
jgi:hypothetical protein